MKNPIEKVQIKPLLIVVMAILMVVLYYVYLTTPQKPVVSVNNFYGFISNVQDNAIVMDGYFMSATSEQVGTKVNVTAKIYDKTKFEKTVHYYDLSPPNPDGKSNYPNEVLPGSLFDLRNPEFNIQNIQVYSQKNIYGKESFNADLIKYEYLVVQR